MISPYRIEAFVYDLMHSNELADNGGDLLQRYSSLPEVSWQGLPVKEKQAMQSRTRNYTDVLKRLRFKKVNAGDAYQKIFLNNRMYELTATELRPYRTWFGSKASFYICLEHELLQKAFYLLAVMRSKGLDYRVLSIRSAYRSPNHNDKVRGALNSMHLYGKALDIVIGDVDGSGKADMTDKRLVYEILDKQVIGNRGGLGFYPRTMIIHMDIRGRRARWDEYKRAGN